MTSDDPPHDQGRESATITPLEAAHRAYEVYDQLGNLKTSRLSDGAVIAIVEAYARVRPADDPTARALLQRLVAGWEKVEPHVNRAFAMQHVHGGGGFSGPKDFADALKDARAHLAQCARPVADEAVREAANTIIADARRSCRKATNSGGFTEAAYQDGIVFGAEAVLSALAAPQDQREREDAQPYKDALHDLVMLKAQDDIGCVPAPTKDQWTKAWAEAEELVRVEP